jgi:hypothetical protein
MSTTVSDSLISRDLAALKTGRTPLQSFRDAL